MHIYIYIHDHILYQYTVGMYVKLLLHSVFAQGLIVELQIAELHDVLLVLRSQHAEDALGKPRHQALLLLLAAPEDRVALATAAGPTSNDAAVQA